MSTKSKVYVAVMLTAACASLASAGTWVKYENVYPNAIVNVTGVGGVYAGAYNIRVAESDTKPTASNAGYGSVSFCVDVVQHSYGDWAPYSIVSGAQLDTLPVPGAMGDTKELNLKQLFSQAFEVDGIKVLNQTTAVALQVSVWEIIKETAGTAYGLGTGAWITSGASSDVANLANKWLGIINAGGALPVYQDTDLYAVSSPTYQDYSIVLPSTKSEEPVPEPLTMATAFLAIGGLGGYLRKRIRTAAA